MNYNVFEYKEISIFLIVLITYDCIFHFREYVVPIFIKRYLNTNEDDVVMRCLSVCMLVPNVPSFLFSKEVSEKSVFFRIETKYSRPSINSIRCHVSHYINHRETDPDGSPNRRRGSLWSFQSSIDITEHFHIRKLEIEILSPRRGPVDGCSCREWTREKRSWLLPSWKEDGHTLKNLT